MITLIINCLVHLTQLVNNSSQWKNRPVSSEHTFSEDNLPSARPLAVQTVQTPEGVKGRYEGD